MADQRMRTLMQNLYDANREFKSEWDSWFNKNPQGKEPTEVSIARDRFWDALNLLFAEKLDPLRKSFLADSADAIDGVIDFLSIDIPAFRCGYEKEWYLGKLKSVPLTNEQQNRLKNIALELAGRRNYRREFKDWARLMIALADEPFVWSLKNLSLSPEHFIQKNARWMLKVILDNRPDLNTEAPVNLK